LKDHLNRSIILNSAVEADADAQDIEMISLERGAGLIDKAVK